VRLRPALLTLSLLLAFPPLPTSAWTVGRVKEPKATDPTSEDEPETEDEPGTEAEDEPETEIEIDSPETVEVTAQRPKSAATDEVVPRQVIETFPHRDAVDLLRLSPGLHLSAHGGRGKAYQIFVRGFDAVHGSDVAVSLEGIPMNEASHIHGQGYLDLHFIPPEAVLGLDLTKGATRPERGDFAIAASADYRVGLAEPGLQAGFGGGTDRSVRGLMAYRPASAAEDTFVVADAEWGEGIGERRGHRAARAMAGVGGDVGQAHLRWIGAAYSGWFESPGVLREDDLESGAVDLYDAYLDVGGGVSRRLLTAGMLEVQGTADRLRAQLYLGYRDLRLVRNFTGWAFHPDTGDARQQAQESGTLGGQVRYTRGFSLARDVTTVEAGLGVRVDRITQFEQGLDMAGAPWATYADADITAVNPGGWIGADVGLFERVRIVPSVRLDLLHYRVVSRVDDLGQAIAEPAPASAQAWVASPKAVADVTIARGWHGYLSYGRGFRSPQARGLDDGDVAPVTSADTVEVGTHLARIRGLDVRVAGFATFIGNELVFDHVQAKFLASGSTRRLGGELAVEVVPLRWLRFEADLTYADGRYTASGEAIPYAPRLLVAGGVYVDHRATVAHGPAAGAPLAVAVGLRSWVLGPRPLPEQLVSHTAWVTDLVAELALGPLFVQLQVDNLFARPWRDGEFVYPSCFDPADPCSALPVRHVTAGTPWALRTMVGIHVR